MGGEVRDAGDVGLDSQNTDVRIVLSLPERMPAIACADLKSDLGDIRSEQIFQVELPALRQLDLNFRQELF